MYRLISHGQATRSTFPPARVIQSMLVSLPWGRLVRAARYALRCSERRFQALGQLHRIVGSPEVHIEETGRVLEAVIVNRRDVDAVLPEGLRDGIDFAIHEDEVAGDGRLAVGGRLEVHHR